MKTLLLVIVATLLLVSAVYGLPKSLHPLRTTASLSLSSTFTACPLVSPITEERQAISLLGCNNNLTSFASVKLPSPWNFAGEVSTFESYESPSFISLLQHEENLTIALARITPSSINNPPSIDFLSTWISPTNEVPIELIFTPSNQIYGITAELASTAFDYFVPGYAPRRVASVVPPFLSTSDPDTFLSLYLPSTTFTLPSIIVILPNATQQPSNLTVWTVPVDGSRSHPATSALFPKLPGIFLGGVMRSTSLLGVFAPSNSEGGTIVLGMMDTRRGTIEIISDTGIPGTEMHPMYALYGPHFSLSMDLRTLFWGAFINVKLGQDPIFFATEIDTGLSRELPTRPYPLPVDGYLEFISPYSY